MPSSNERALEKAKTLACDGLILDLEDAVAPDAKPAAREAAAAAAASGEYGRRTLTIRVNGIGTEWHDDDLVAAAAGRPGRASSSPRSTAPPRCAQLVAALEKAGAPDHTRLWAMVETPDAILDVARASPAASDRLSRAGDGHQRPGQGAVRRARARPRADAARRCTLSLLAARAAGIAILDGVYNDVKDTDGFLAECQQGREMGFDGKTLIHPGQVEGANAAFAPVRAGRRGRPRHPPGLGGRPGLRRRHLQRPDGREPPRRVGAAHPHASTRPSVR